MGRLLWLVHPALAAAMVGTAHGITPLETGRVSNKCSALPAPKQIPAVDQLVDSAGMAAALSHVQPGEYIVSVGFAPGRAPTVQALSTTPTVPDSIVAIVQAAIRPTASVDAPRIRLRVHLSMPRRLVLTRSELCDPVPLDAGRVGSVTVATTSPSPARVRNPTIRLKTPEKVDGGCPLRS